MDLELNCGLTVATESFELWVNLDPAPSLSTSLWLTCLLSLPLPSRPVSVNLHFAHLPAPPPLWTISLSFLKPIASRFQNASKVAIYTIGCFHKDCRGCENTDDFRWRCHDSFVAYCVLSGLGRMGGLQKGGRESRADS